MSNGYFYYLNNIVNLVTKHHFKGWGRKKTGRFALWCHKFFGGELTLLEDGFIRSIGLGVDGSPSFSLVEDDIGIYYDATVPSKLENILNTYDFQTDTTLMEDTQKAMTMIVEYNISKYNHAPNVGSDFFEHDDKPKVLIVAQTSGDASLEYGRGNVFTTKDMIADAIKDNPHASVYLKIHPDVLVGKKSSDILLDEIPKACSILDSDVNPISLLKHFDKVYTKTSGMGMEALILGLDVVCYGMPYYAGWGLTSDKIKCERRVRELSKEEIFATAYILYTRYYNPYRHRDSDIFDTINEIILQRKRKVLDIKNHYLVLGDSHIRVFENTLFSRLMKQYTFNVSYVPGATAYGIENIYSTTGAYRKFLETLNRYDYEHIIVTLGEVDCAYTLWSLVQKNNEPMEVFFMRSIIRYIDFIKLLTSYAMVTVISVPLPTVDDFTECDDSISGVRKTPLVSLEERILLTHRFNLELNKRIEKMIDVNFLELTPYVLDKQTGKLKTLFLNSDNPCDHHYKRSKFALLLIWKIFISKFQLYFRK